MRDLRAFSKVRGENFQTKARLGGGGTYIHILNHALTYVSGKNYPPLTVGCGGGGGISRRWAEKPSDIPHEKPSFSLSLSFFAIRLYEKESLWGSCGHIHFYRACSLSLSRGKLPGPSALGSFPLSLGQYSSGSPLILRRPFYIDDPP